MMYRGIEHKVEDYFKSSENADKIPDLYNRRMEKKANKDMPSLLS